MGGRQWRVSCHNQMQTIERWRCSPLFALQRGVLRETHYLGRLRELTNSHLFTQFRFRCANRHDQALVKSPCIELVRWLSDSLVTWAWEAGSVKISELELGKESICTEVYRQLEGASVLRLVRYRNKNIAQNIGFPSSLTYTHPKRLRLSVDESPRPSSE